MKEWEEILYVMDVDRITTEPCFFGVVPLL